MMMKNDDRCGDLTVALETVRGEALRSNDVIICGCLEQICLFMQ